MDSEPQRVESSTELGRAGRGLDIALGVAAIAPIGLLCWAAATANVPTLPAVRTATAIWVGCLLAFLSGVRRGLSFSERAGARLTEISSFLGVFLVAILALTFRSPGLGVLGLALVGVLDHAAARRGEAPLYFRLFRPVQMGVGCLGLLFIATRTGL